MKQLTIEQQKSICDAMPSGKGYSDSIDAKKTECYQSIGTPDFNHQMTRGDIIIDVSLGLAGALIVVGIIIGVGHWLLSDI